MGRCPLIFIWTDVVQVRMPSSLIVEQFNVFKHALPCLFLCSIVFVIHKLCFKTAKETFSNCIVIAIAFAAHASTDRAVQIVDTHY